ncbi:23S rRNA (guanosine(2251)-2'-O)-methyltransferase RlmB [bacterium]|nr:23S rRNA (guanosine(2251)-2'-O)-methyltransferase RlmB [bacterium]MBU1983690.1 23S rRNA (guanosine(2251)-2'-O)-methyltransferase RlmB [bacterium]
MNRRKGKGSPSPKVGSRAPASRGPAKTDKPGPTAGLFHLYGRKPILEALRLGLVQNVELTRRAHGQTITAIREQAERQRVPISMMDSFPVEEGLTVQGVRALARPPVMRYDIRDFLASLPDSPPPLIAMLDGVTDPQNLGAILRSAEAAAVSAVVIRERRQAGITEAVVKASAGAAYLVPVFQVVNLSQAARMARESGFWVVATAAEPKALSYRSYHWNGKTLLILGSEGMGVSALLRRDCDVVVSIPIFGSMDSLNVSVAAGILFFEAARGRGLIE